MDKGRNGKGKGVRPVVFVLASSGGCAAAACLCVLCRFLSLPDSAQVGRPAPAALSVLVSSCLFSDAIRGWICQRQGLR